MPLSSWKKKVKKNNHSISQIFRDQIQSQRLVVETGFPAILVDLIVKNRNRRLKGSSEIEVLGGSCLPTPPSPPILLNDMVVVEEERVDTACSQEIKGGETRKGLLLMVGFLAVLNLGVTKFAVGLTASAFVLIFVEYLRKHYCFEGLIPCFDAKNFFKLMMGKVLRFIRGIRDPKLAGKDSGLEEEMNSSTSRRVTLIHKSSVDEIQSVKLKSLLVDSNDDVDRDVERIENGIDKSGSNGNLKRTKLDSLAALIEEAYDSEIKKKLKKSGKAKPDSLAALIEEAYDSEIKKKKKKSGKAKITQLKHVFSKKSSRKEKKAEITEINPTLTTENAAVNNLEHRDGNSSSISSITYEGEEESTETPVPESDDSDSNNVVVVAAESESQKRGNSGYLFLCIIVLIGLYGGRISALLLILSYCLVKSSGGMLRRYAGFCL